jgi:DNA repair exonuclease SbcCD ATPase subunit
MAKTNEQLSLEITQLRVTVAALQASIVELTQNTNSRVMLSDLSRSETNLNNKIKDLSEMIVKIEEKLAKISLPDDTRYYLGESEIADFRANFNKLLAMLTSFELLYNNLVAYSVNNVNNA